MTTNDLLDFHATLFERVFVQPLTARIKDPLRLRAVRRQIEDAADAASQWLGRFFKQRRLSIKETQAILKGLLPMGGALALAELGNPNIAADTLTRRVLSGLPIPKPIQQTQRQTEFEVAAHGLIQVLSIVAPVLLDWQRAKFANSYEPVRRIVLRLHQTSDQIDALGHASNADERFELGFRDHLLQRFFKIDVGLIRATGQLDVDLRQLWVMPNVGPVRGPIRRHEKLMDVAAARAAALRPGPSKPLPASVAEIERTGLSEWLDGEIADAFDAAKAQPAFEAVLQQPRLVLVGAPGSGKSTLMEWLQVQVAGAEIDLIANDQQAIPLLLRVRELVPILDTLGTPDTLDALIAHAPGGAPQAALMPQGWLTRQMQAGRVLLMLDGLDECEPTQRDGQLLPWLRKVIERYPDNRYLVSTRPVAYAPETLLGMGFAERELREFDDGQRGAYVQRWCAAIDPPANPSPSPSPSPSARGGAALVERILAAITQDETARSLARNPLLLAALCLTYYFDDGTDLDHNTLYRTCIEGLLHHWDVRRGIRSAFTLDEKLRACREIALAMHDEDRAEYTAAQVLRVLEATLQDKARARRLLDHLRQRSGLFLERRPGVFAFAHLSFQEFLSQ